VETKTVLSYLAIVTPSQHILALFDAIMHIYNNDNAYIYAYVDRVPGNTRENTLFNLSFVLFCCPELVLSCLGNSI
jgi:hypothetical protein